MTPHVEASIGWWQPPVHSHICQTVTDELIEIISFHRCLCREDHYVQQHWKQSQLSTRGGSWGSGAFWGPLCRPLQPYGERWRRRSCEVRHVSRAQGRLLPRGGAEAGARQAAEPSRPPDGARSALRPLPVRLPVRGRPGAPRSRRLLPAGPPLLGRLHRRSRPASAQRPDRSRHAALGAPQPAAAAGRAAARWAAATPLVPLVSLAPCLGLPRLLPPQPAPPGAPRPPPWGTPRRAGGHFGEPPQRAEMGLLRPGRRSGVRVGGRRRKHQLPLCCLAVLASSQVPAPVLRRLSAARGAQFKK